MHRPSIVLAALALTIFAAGSAFAKNKVVSDPSKVLDSADVATVAAIIAEVGGQRVETHDDNNQKTVTFFHGEQSYTVSVTACDAGKCIVVAPMALVDTSPTTLTSDQLIKINSDNIYLSSFKVGGNTIAFAHVLIIDGGVTRQNLAVNIQDFVDTFESTLRKLANPLTSSLQGQGGHPAAMSYVRFRSVVPSPRDIQAISGQLAPQYRDLLTRGSRR